MDSDRLREFSYVDERFADVCLLRYRVDELQHMSLREKKLVFYLSQAALWGRDILWDQNYRHNLRLRRVLEEIYVRRPEDWADDEDWAAFTVYVKRVWFANGVHHHYSMDKFRPGFGKDFFERAVGLLGDEVLPLEGGLSRADLLRLLEDVIFSPEVDAKRVSLDDSGDLLLDSAANYYGSDVSRVEAEAFYGEMKARWDGDADRPVMFGLNSRLVRMADGRLGERVWRSGGLYGAAIDRIVEQLLLARGVADSVEQAAAIDALVSFYRSGDLGTFDEYTVLWVRATGGRVDFTNGFTETYGDALGLKASWEGYVNVLDEVSTERSLRLCGAAGWFEEHAPIDDRFRKKVCRGVSAKVVRVAMLGGDLYPSSAIGINLPNSDWVRRDYGSKSVRLSNLTEAYDVASRGSGLLEEFVVDADMVDFVKRYGDVVDDLHTDLHECLGHGSGCLLSGVDGDALRNYGATIEEARADLFALYFIADAKMQELGLLESSEAYRAGYYTYLMNGLLTQLARIERGRSIEEAHMRNRALICRWVLAHGEGVVRLTVRSGKHYVVVDDFVGLRVLFGRLLGEVQRIKSEGDFDAARALVEGYGVCVDGLLHEEVLSRYGALNIAPYKGFINPVLRDVRDEAGEIVDVEVVYGEAFDEQMLRYGRDYSALGVVNV